MSEFDPSLPVMVHDRLNDRTFEWKPATMPANYEKYAEAFGPDVIELGRPVARRLAAARRSALVPAIDQADACRLSFASPCHVAKAPKADFAIRRNRTRSHAFCLASGKQLAAAEIVDRQHDALEVVPPDRWRDADVGPNNWRHQLGQHGQAVIVVGRRAVVAFDA
jgi:hypothetical protein